MRPESAPAPVFLLSHRGALGDFALTWPLLRRLRALHPGHRFVGLGRPSHLELAVALGLLDEALDAESSDLLPFLAGEAVPEALATVDRALAWANPDDALQRLLAAFPGPAALHPPFPPAGGPHVVEHHLSALARFGFAPESFEDEPFLLPGTPAFREGILLHPGSGSKAKNFRREFYARLAETLPAWSGSGMKVSFVLGPVEEEAGDGAFYRARFSVVTPSSPLDLARLIASSALYVGNDSGPAHVAALLGAPTFALYRSTDPRVWGVRGPFARSIAAADEENALRELHDILSASIRRTGIAPFLVSRP